MKKILDNLIITGAPGWFDVTDELEVGAPFTLARSDGFGALQFSLATYKSGQVPAIGLDQLRQLLADFGFSREFGRGFDHKEVCGPLMVCAESFKTGQQFVRVWYCSGGRDIVLATYVCERGREGNELVDCENMIQGLTFVS